MGNRGERGPDSPRWRGGRWARDSGYVFVFMPGHPRARQGGQYVLEHILVAEKALGKHLPPRAVVHHVDEDRGHNENRNLVVCQDDAYHMILHWRARVVRAGGHPAAENLCCRCRQVKPFEDFHRDRTRWNGRISTCKACLKQRDHEKWRLLHPEGKRWTKLDPALHPEIARLVREGARRVEVAQRFGVSLARVDQIVWADVP